MLGNFRLRMKPRTALSAALLFLAGLVVLLSDLDDLDESRDLASSPATKRVLGEGEDAESQPEGRGKGVAVVLKSYWGDAGFNNERQVLMTHAWAAKQLGMNLVVPRTFTRGHESYPIALEDAFDLEAIREYVGGDVTYSDQEGEEEEVDATVRVAVNMYCTALLDGDLLRAKVRKGLLSKLSNAPGKLPGDDGNGTADADAEAGAVRYNVALSGLKWLTLDGAFVPGSDDSRELFEAFRPAPDIERCADLAMKTIVEGGGSDADALCPGGDIHGVHLRVGDRTPTPLFDCQRGPEVMGRDLQEHYWDGHCQENEWKGDILHFEEVLEKDLPPPPEGGGGGEGEEGRCVYVATNDVKSDYMTAFRTWAAEQQVRVLTYDDVVVQSAPMREAGCDRREGRGPNPSLFEQALLSRVPGRYAAQFPSSWDPEVLHARARREEAGEEMYMAREDLELYQSKIVALQGKNAAKQRSHNWCLRLSPY